MLYGWAGLAVFISFCLIYSSWRLWVFLARLTEYIRAKIGSSENEWIPFMLLRPEAMREDLEFSTLDSIVLILANIEMFFLIVVSFLVMSKLEKKVEKNGSFLFHRRFRKHNRHIDIAASTNMVAFRLYFFVDNDNCPVFNYSKRLCHLIYSKCV